MNNVLTLSPHYILKEEIGDTLINIEKGAISILGNKFSVQTDNKGDFITIKNISLDQETASRLTCLMWSLNFLHLTFYKSNDQFGTAELRRKVIKLLQQILIGFTNSNSLQDIASITKSIERRIDFIKDGKIQGDYKYISPDQCA